MTSDEGLATVTFKMDREQIEEFDDLILQARASGEIPKDYSRSDVLRNLVDEWVDEHREDDQGNPKPLAQPAD